MEDKYQKVLNSLKKGMSYYQIRGIQNVSPIFIKKVADENGIKLSRKRGFKYEKNGKF